MGDRWDAIKVGLLFFFALGVLAVPVVLFFRTAQTKQDGPILPRPTSQQSESEVIKEQLASENGNTTKGVFESGRYFISLNGSILNQADLVGQNVSFDFLAAEDPNREVMSVIVQPTEGIIPMGFYDGSFETTYSTRLVPYVEVPALLGSGQTVQLRFMYYPNAILTEEEERVKAMLDGFIDGRWTVPDGVRLYPVGLGILQ